MKFRISEPHWRRPIIHDGAAQAVLSLVDEAHSDDQITHVNERVTNLAKVVGAVVERLDYLAQRDIFRALGCEIEDQP